MTDVAPGVRFSDFDIFLTPALAFAIDFIWRTSSLVHSRRTIFLALAIPTPVLVRRPCITRHDDGNGMTNWRVYNYNLETNEAFAHMPVRPSRARWHPMWVCRQRRRAHRQRERSMAQTGNVYTTHTLCGLLATLEVKLPPGPYQPWNAGGTDDASNLAWRSHRCRSSVTANTMVAGHPRPASQNFLLRAA